MSEWDWSAKSSPKPPPKTGIKVRKVGATWWGQRWIQSLEHLSREYLNRLGRGRAYARAGRVHDLQVQRGHVRANVTGSEPIPYVVDIRLPVFSNVVWKAAIGEMSKQALFAADLLAGRMPEDIDRAFGIARKSLFPRKQHELETDCSCPDWANPCKHVAAVHYVLGEAFDKDPFLLFELRGRTKDQVMRALMLQRSHLDDLPADSVSEPSQAISVAMLGDVGYEVPRAPLPRLSFQMEPPAAAASVLYALGTPRSWSLAESPAEFFAPIYRQASAFARELAFGSPTEDSTSASITGSPPPSEQRMEEPVADDATNQARKRRGSRAGRSKTDTP